MLFDKMESLFEIVWDGSNVSKGGKIPERLPIKIDEVKKAILATTNYYNITFTESKDFDAVYGMVRKMKTLDRSSQIKTYDQACDSYHAQIFWKSGLNKCWKRFVLCKELMHLVLDDTGSMVDSSVELKQLAMAMMTSSNEFMTENIQAARKSEEMAVLAALELLFPIQYRHGLIRQKDERKYTNKQIAEVFLIPEMYVNIALNPLFHEMFKAIALEDSPKRFSILEE